MSKFLYHQKPEEVKGHTRCTFAGNYNPENKVLVIGVAGNHKVDSFCKSKGRMIATGRSEKIRKALQDSGKQVVINNVSRENARNVFFQAIKD